jgi:CheY-like chemotaxis protein
LLPISFSQEVSEVSADTEKTILLVDNQPKETAALRKQLEFAGFKTQVAHTGTGAINSSRPM